MVMIIYNVFTKITLIKHPIIPNWFTFQSAPNIEDAWKKVSSLGLAQHAQHLSWWLQGSRTTWMACWYSAQLWKTSGTKTCHTKKSLKMFKAKQLLIFIPQIWDLLPMCVGLCWYFRLILGSQPFSTSASHAFRSLRTVLIPIRARKRWCWSSTGPRGYHGP